MNYLKIYNSLMNRAKNRLLDNIYFEKHHIILKSLGGSNDKDNIVKLTYREHFLAHWLLYRIYPDNKQIAAAFHILAFGTNCRTTRKDSPYYIPSSRAFEEAKIAKRNARIGFKHSEETINKIKKTWKQKTDAGYIGPTVGKITSDETKEKQRLSKIGKKRPQEVIDKIADTKKKQYLEYLNKNNGIGKKMSPETKNKIRKSNTGKIRSDEAKEKNKTLEYWNKKDVQ